MAKRENQGLQIALIVFVMVTVLLMVTTVLFWKRADTAIAKAADSETRLTDSQRKLSTAQDELGKLKEQMLGYPRDAALTEIETDFQKFVQTYAQSLPEDQRNYRSFPEQMMKTVAEKSQRLVKAAMNEAALQKRLEEVQQLESARASKAVEEKEGAEKQRAEERAQFTQERERIKTQLAGELQQYQKNLGERQEAIQQRDQQITAKEKDIRSLALKNEMLQNEIGRRTESLDVPDGKIVGVNQQDRLVWINLGTADAVRPQMTFDVYGGDEINFAEPNAKGKIEILRVVDDHSSEARIRSDELADPILRGDIIHSHIWQPGKKLRFALVGNVDVDDDGRSDTELVRDLIEINGGVVDAIVDEKGQKTGEITIQTRYLVLGDPPSDQDVVRGAYSSIIADAETLGVEKISLDRILAFVGYDGKERTVPLGNEARAVDFKAKAADGVVRTSRGSVSSLYEKEKPPLRRVGNARSSPKTD